MMNKKVLTIAGSDSCGGAGIQADLKVMCAYGVYGMSVVTAVTAQNTKGVWQVNEMPSDLVEEQLFRVMEDMRPDAVKIGMVCSKENVEAIVRQIDRWQIERIVLDPVMVSSSGRRLLSQEAEDVMREKLFGRVAMVTPNLLEAEKLASGLAGQGVWKEEATPSKERREGGRMGEVESMARVFSEHWHTAFLIKGGHLEGNPADYLYHGTKGKWFPGERIRTRHTHGTGCTLSTAIACGLAKGASMEEAAAEAKEYLTGCIMHHPGIGGGNGPLNHLWRMEERR